MGETSVKVNFIGDSSSLKRAVDDVDDNLGRAGGSFAKVRDTALGVFGGQALTAGAAKLGSAIKGAFDAFEESRRVTAQTEAVIKSTGEAAGVTADQIADLAGAISAKTGIDDEAIQKGQNLLLTFTNIKNQAGENNDIFNRATKIMVDMGAAMGTDASGSAIQLGKALNDPIAGISALSRVGVTFTDAQKEQIRVMVEAGDVAAAQGVILDELGKEFGGSAEAQATASAKMKVAFGNLQEQIGEKLAPVMDRLATWIVEVGIPAFERLAAWVEQHWPEIQARIEQAMTRIREVIETVLNWIEAFWRTWGGTITAYVEGMWNIIRERIEAILKIIQGVINVIMGLIHGDFSQVWEGIKQIFTGALDYIRSLIDQAMLMMRLAIEVAMRLIAGIFDGAWDGIKRAVGAAAGAVVGSIAEIPGKITGLGADFLNAGAHIVGQLVSGVLGGMKGIGEGAADFAAGFANAVIDVVNDKVIDGINRKLEFTVSTGPLGKLPGIPNEISFNPPDLPHIPRLASGGIVKARQGGVLALLGEAGDDEAVIPLKAGRDRLSGPQGGSTTVTVAPGAIVVHIGEIRSRRDADYLLEQLAAGDVARELAARIRGAVA